MGPGGRSKGVGNVGLGRIGFNKKIFRGRHGSIAVVVESARPNWCLSQIAKKLTSKANPPKLPCAVLPLDPALLPAPVCEPHPCHYQFTTHPAKTIESIFGCLLATPNAPVIFEVIAHLSPILVRQHAPDFPAKWFREKPGLKFCLS